MKTEVYIHIPFCIRKCAYCDFLSFPAQEDVKRRYIDALQEEIRQSAVNAEIETVFIGGGTPSVLPAEWIAETLAVLRERFSVRENAEITIEANPGTVDAEKLQVWKQAGINRISFGCQSFQEKELRLLGRIHTVREIYESVKLARKAGFANINLDLMSGLPGQSPAVWEDTLRKAAALQPEHISAYSLIIEEGTPFYGYYGEPGEESGDTSSCGSSFAHDERMMPPLPDEENERRMYERTGVILNAYGYRQYEISNYAKEGYACRHNTGYWTGVPYIGFGLGAAGFLPRCMAEEPAAGDRERVRDAGMSRDTGISRDTANLWQKPWVRYKNTDHLPDYLKRSREYAEYQVLAQRDLEAEFLILGLRMTEGIEDAEFARRFGHTMDSVYGEVLDKYEQMGLLIRACGHTRLSSAGISVSNAVLADFLP